MDLTLCLQQGQNKIQWTQLNMIVTLLAKKILPNEIIFF